MDTIEHRNRGERKHTEYLLSIEGSTPNPVNKTAIAPNKVCERKFSGDGKYLIQISIIKATIKALRIVPIPGF